MGHTFPQDNALLERPLTLADIKPRLLGDRGLTSGLNLLYIHLDLPLPQMSTFLIDGLIADRLCPRAFAVIKRLNTESERYKGCHSKLCARALVSGASPPPRIEGVGNLDVGVRCNAPSRTAKLLMCLKKCSVVG